VTLILYNCNLSSI